MVLPPRGPPQMLHPHVPKTEEPHRLLQDESSVSLLADNIADALIAQVKLQLDKMRALVANGTEPTVAPPLAEHLPSPRWTAGTLGVVGGHRASLYRSSSKGPPEFYPISEESQCCPEEASGVSSASRHDPDLNMYDLNINPDLSQSDFSERDVNSRLQKGASKCSTPSKRSENRFDPARARKLAKAAMTLRESPLESEIHNLGGGGALENLAENLADILPMRRSTLTSRHDTVIPTTQAGRKTVQVLPNSVSGAWRRQAKVLAAQMREEMAEEVKMAKNNMSFRGGLWWLRQLVGLRTLTKPRQARYISLIVASLTLAAFSFSFYWEGSEVFIARNLLDAAVVASAVIGLLIHHFCSKLSENCLSAGEQDGLLQAHSVAFGYTQPWLVISRDHGNHLLLLWICCVLSRVTTKIYETRSVESYLRVQTVATGVIAYILASGIICALCMRVGHICSAMRTSMIQYMQELSSEDVSFEGMAQEWNTIQIFVRTLCDGCSYSLALQVGMIPVMAASTIFRILWSDSNMVDMLFSLLPFLATSLMPFHALVTAASTTQQCEQSPQVANSMLVSEWDNSMSQDLLAFMSRCDIGFFINDLRVTPAAVMKSTYVLVGVLVTIVSSSADRYRSILTLQGLDFKGRERKALHPLSYWFLAVSGGRRRSMEKEVKPDDLDDTERLPKESEAWPQLFPPANTSAQARHDAEKAAAVAMQAGDFTGAINVYTEAMRSGGSNPQMLCTRSALLLKMKRPCAAIRDCTAALKINNHMVKAYRLRGMAHRRLGHWKKAYRDLTEAGFWFVSLSSLE
ncbi:TDX [Symbiodinium sp. CCMP2592]|nr:TDX [Symbiodinium sp. CCMP2592]